MKNEKLINLLKEAEDLLKAIPGKTLDSRESQELQSTITSIDKIISLIKDVKTTELITISEELSDLIKSFMSTKEWLQEVDRSTSKIVLNNLFVVKGVINGQGFKYFTTQSMIVPKRKKILIVSMIVFAVCIAIGTVVSILINLKRKKKRGAISSTVTSKKRKNDKAFEIIESSMITSTKTIPDDLRSTLECTYTFLFMINEARKEIVDTFIRKDVQKDSSDAVKSEINTFKLFFEPNRRVLKLGFKQLKGIAECIFEVSDLPLYKWFVIHIVVASNTAKVYMNGDLVRTFHTHTCGFIVENQQGIHLTFDTSTNTPPSIKTRYFKLHDGILDGTTIKLEALSLIKDVFGEKKTDIKKKCNLLQQ
jgi:hypothetical protein